MNSEDKKAFLIGVVASMFAVVVWDVIKFELGFLNPRLEK
jgi:hypothetical protein